MPRSFKNLDRMTEAGLNRWVVNTFRSYEIAMVDRVIALYKLQIIYRWHS